jgi:hypothetical protein
MLLKNNPNVLSLVLQNPGAARARVTELFSFDRREQQLKAIFTKL